MVEVHDNSFEPAGTQVTIGGTVVWDFSTAERPHNVVFSAHQESDIQAAGTWTTAFDEAGTYPYECTLHTGMTGAIEVAEG